VENPLVRKLEQFTRLSADDKAALARAASERVRMVGAREDVIAEGDRPRLVNLILEGWACSYKYLPDGRRQIIAFFLPGDLCDLNLFILSEMDHSIGTITPSKVAEIQPALLDEITMRHPRVTQALWWETLVAGAIQREWTVNVGQRSALERIAHVMCELILRLRAVGLTSGDSCEWPLTQAELADTCGLSPVHVNRTLQELRAAGLISLKGRRLTVPDLEALKDAAMFNTNYLHLGREGRHLDANE
jgi:CRP-like cAMP-binding protein